MPVYLVVCSVTNVELLLCYSIPSSSMVNLLNQPRYSDSVDALLTHCIQTNLHDIILTTLLDSGNFVSIYVYDPDKQVRFFHCYLTKKTAGYFELDQQLQKKDKNENLILDKLQASVHKSHQHDLTPNFC